MLSITFTREPLLPPTKTNPIDVTLCSRLLVLIFCLTFIEEHTTCTMPGSHFLKLPPEIRSYIYQYAFAQFLESGVCRDIILYEPLKRSSELRRLAFVTDSALARTCKIFREEILREVFGAKVLLLVFDEDSSIKDAETSRNVLVQHLGPQRMRYLDRVACIHRSDLGLGNQFQLTFLSS